MKKSAMNELAMKKLEEMQLHSACVVVAAKHTVVFLDKSGAGTERKSFYYLVEHG